MAYEWTGAHAYRDHANDRRIEPGETLPEDVADDIVASHPHDVEEIDEGGDEDTDGDVCGYYEDGMDEPCQRDPGWGRDADDGPCKDHVED